MSKPLMRQTPWLLRYRGWSGRAIGLLLGALAVLGHAPFHFWPIAVLSLAALYGRLQWAAEDDRPGKAGFSASFWWALGYFAVGMHWIGVAFIARGPGFIPLMPFMVGGLALILALFWGLAGIYFARLKAQGLMAVIAFTAVFTLAEIARGHAFGGLPWNLPGYIFEAGSRPSQIARWINIYGLSFIVLLISAALGQALFWRQAKWPLVLMALPLISLFGIGHLRLKNAVVEAQPDIRLRIVSVPFDQADKMMPSTSIVIVNDFIGASLTPGLENITHVIWPEGAVNGLVLENEPLLNAVGGSFAAIDDTPPIWLINSLIEEKERGRVRYYNASVAIEFDANGIPAVAGSNRKSKLVPFGEHIPFMDWMEDMQIPLISTNLASISPERPKKLSNFPGLPRLSPQICYEIIFPGFTPIDKNYPPEFILNQSNDAWFGQLIGPAQHANIARYRAIETGLPIIRAASNGISGVVDPWGRLHSKVSAIDVFHSDTTLPKPLKMNTKGKLITTFWLLLNMFACVIIALIQRRGVGSRLH